MRKVKVVHILHAVGGVDVSLRLILENIDSERFKNVVIHGNVGSERKYFDDKGNKIKEYILPIQREINLLKDFRTIVSTIKILKKEKPNIIHAHSAKGGVIGRVAAFAVGLKVLHTPQAYSYLSEQNGLKRKVFLFVERFLARLNSILLASSTSELNRGLKEVKYRLDKALIYNNSINAIKLDFYKAEVISKELNLPDEYICTVGRPSYQKNIEMMIEVVKNIKDKIPNVHLVIMGIGAYNPNTDNVKALIKKYNLESSITMIKWIDREDIFAIIAKSKFYISTARYEGLPYSIIESLALGKACVVTDCDGNRDLIEDGFNGFVIEQDDVSTMSSQIVKLYYENNLRAKFEKNSKLIYDSTYNVKVNISTLQSIYERYAKE